MKIYLSTENPKNEFYKWANSLPMFDGIVLNSEATEIICDHFISSFRFEEIPELLSRIFTKMRLGCELTIIDVDVEMACRSIHVEEINQREVNKILFDNQKRKSIFSMDVIEKYLPENVTITNKHYENGNCTFILKCRRKT